MNHYLIAYAVNKGFDMITPEDARRLTHVNLAFGIIRDGLLSLEKLTMLDRLDNLRVKNPELKIVLSVGGWGAGGFSDMAMTDEGRRAFAASVQQAMDRYGLDGIDIDWEYPCSGAAEIDHAAQDRENFTHLLHALRVVAGDRIVSIAAGAGAYFIEGTEMDKVADICDYVQLMTYDMRSGFSTQAGHHTALYASKGGDEGMTVARAVELFRNAGVPAEKIVIGAAFYSRRWDGVPNVNRGLLQQAETVGQYGPGYSTLLADYIDKNGWVRYWDQDAMAPFLFNGSGLISYDDPASLRLKCQYLKNEKLRGIMYWEHSSDATHTLLAAMHEALY
ncbi:MAG: chitinase [Clostridiales bacterium]|nr:chitinase [Clostridiales bacterium]